LPAPQHDPTAVTRDGQPAVTSPFASGRCWDRGGGRSSPTLENPTAVTSLLHTTAVTTSTAVPTSTPTPCPADAATARATAVPRRNSPHTSTGSGCGGHVPRSTAAPQLPSITLPPGVGRQELTGLRPDGKCAAAAARQRGYAAAVRARSSPFGPRPPGWGPIPPPPFPACSAGPRRCAPPRGADGVGGRGSAAGCSSPLPHHHTRAAMPKRGPRRLRRPRAPQDGRTRARKPPAARHGRRKAKLPLSLSAPSNAALRPRTPVGYETAVAPLSLSLTARPRRRPPARNGRRVRNGR
jgi:hypothetical protein